MQPATSSRSQARMNAEGESEKTMRYEVRVICSGTFGELLAASNDATEAKRVAEQHAHEYYYGTAIVDRETGTVDLGDRIVPVEQAFV